MISYKITITPDLTFMDCINYYNYGIENNQFSSLKHVEITE